MNWCALARLKPVKFMKLLTGAKEKDSVLEGMYENFITTHTRLKTLKTEADSWRAGEWQNFWEFK